MEEIDLCWRAKNLGYHITYVGLSKVYHVGGATLEENNPTKTYLNFRNSLFTLTKNSNGNLFITLFLRLLLDGFAGIKFLLEFKIKHTIAIIHAHFSFYGSLPRLLKQRRDTKSKMNYYQIKSIVIAYFLKKKVIYNSL